MLNVSVITAAWMLLGAKEYQEYPATNHNSHSYPTDIAPCDEAAESRIHNTGYKNLGGDGDTRDPSKNDIWQCSKLRRRIPNCPLRLYVGPSEQSSYKPSEASRAARTNGAPKAPRARATHLKKGKYWESAKYF